MILLGKATACLARFFISSEADARQEMHETEGARGGKKGRESVAFFRQDIFGFYQLHLESLAAGKLFAREKNEREATSLLERRSLVEVFDTRCKI
jgi:hypothetical protein